MLHGISPVYISQEATLGARKGDSRINLIVCLTLQKTVAYGAVTVTQIVIDGGGKPTETGGHGCCSDVVLCVNSGTQFKRAQ
jgi:hypothetical protein